MKITDQTGMELNLTDYPTRIVSIVPSQTELLYYLDISPIAQTIFCVHPHHAFNNAYKIGGTKKLSISKIQELQPDLIIGNKEENDQKQIELLRKKFPVYLSDIKTLDNALQMIQAIGTMTRCKNKALALINEIKVRFESLHKMHSSRKRALYLIWQKPYMAVGFNTFINDMLGYAGYENSAAQYERYPELTIADMKNLNPEVILLSSEPFPFKKHHIKEMQVHFPNCEIQLVDGELFSWYGNRLLKAAVEFKRLTP